MKSADASVQPVAADAETDSDSEKKSYFAYFRTRQFYIVLLLGQILALCITATNTFSGLLSSAGTSIPAFQTLFNYVLLTLVYTSFTLYRYGARKWWSQLVLRDWWKYLIFAFCDVQGNYFIVLAYRYTTILSAQLINFWAIVMVVLISFTLLRVRYHWAQYAGILVCIGGMGVLFGSDHITGANSGGPDKSRGDLIKGDLFALLGATFYGLTNVAEEYLVSKRPMYEVLGQLGMYATVIMGVQAAIFDRASFQQAVWNGAVAGYLVGYTLCLFLFYSLAPLLFRLASAAFFNISLLTSNFWGVVIGVKVFGLRIHFLYPIAFVLIIIGQFVYYLGRQVLGEAMKPWLGENQEQGVIGIGTARRRRRDHGTNDATAASADSNV
ncbi:uncharacterized protein ARB_06088 [Trichophyton benhamiae CBS 112371]|uniref:DUF914 domain membrane protein n=1 Tax=Arthroderma benhamiae (strain ATCC MYA-4681 / CBS 112371) TaxID=663331 RepID=D4APC1_ARTBC|nr:uncharacterized protein ARB_06088 [Trichophyton benhamiae CBS 112371]EFE35132.1 hypothetical protein ARB_06088 [Trichophyton benhamiae CBS 112371]